MRIQWKVTLLVLLTLIGTLAAVAWKTRSVLLKDKLSFLADSSMKQIAPLKRLVQERLDDHKMRLVKFAGSRSASAGSAAGHPRTFGEFEVVALMQPQAGEAPAGTAPQWQPAWTEKSPAAKVEQWPQGYELTLLKSLPYGRVKDGETVWARVSDRQGSPIYAEMVSVEIQNATAPAAAPAPGADALPDSTDYKAQPAGTGKRAIVVGFSTSDPLANVTDDYIGSTNTVYIVDERGYVASHVNKSYLGALFTEDPIVDEIIRAKKTAASGNYEDLESRPVLGHFERIDRTNLFAIITSPMATVNESVSAQMKIALQTGAAVGLLALVCAFLLGRSISQPLQEASDAIRALNRGEPHVMRSAVSNDEVGGLMRLLAESSPAALQSKANWNTQKSEEPIETGGGSSTNTKVLAEEAAHNVRLAEERRAAYEVFNEGFTKAIKEPLMAILGHAQLTKSKVESPEVRSHAESIERESRRAQDVLERLENWTTGTAKIDTDSVMDVKVAIEQALQVSAAELEADGIKLISDLHPVPNIRGSMDLMKSAIGHLIDNAREAMRARQEKTLRVQLDFLSDCIYLVVADTGVGMSRDVKAKAFDPFFKGFESPKRLGLGLSFVQTTVKALGGTAEIDSTPGEGASFTLKLPVTADEKKTFRAQEVLRQAEAQQIASAVGTQHEPTPEPASEELPTPVLTQVLPDITEDPLQAPANGLTTGLLSSFTAAARPRPTAEEIETETRASFALPTEPEASRVVIEMTPPPLPPLPLRPMMEPAAPPPPPSAKSVALEEEWSVSSLTPPPLEPRIELQDEDDDEEEAFANVALSQMATVRPLVPPQPNPAPAVSTSSNTMPAPNSLQSSLETPSGTAPNFQVKIRRPRTRS